MAYVVFSEHIQILICIIIFQNVIPERTAFCIMFFCINLIIRRIAFRCFTESHQSSYACFKRNDLEIRF